MALACGAQSFGAQRAIRGMDMTVVRGETNRLYISLEALGDENAVGFSLCYDTNLLKLIGAVRGSAVSNTSPAASFSTNILQAESLGRLGIGIGLSVPRA